MENLSTDVIWELCRNNNAYLVKRRTGGGVQFSRDPLNLMNKHSRKYNGFINEKAVGIQEGDKGGVKLLTRNKDKSSKPASNIIETSWAGHKPARKTYKGVVNQTAKQGYRADLRAEAVARASAIRRSQRPTKDSPPKKLRGAKARKAAAEKEGKSS
ncbi:MAG: 60S ribosomal protein L28 [Watsoniomyces obsoletus]|nr:MAG: 60S ribosomal protein L28 [Watsoniomyces obsoletus]